MVARQRGGGSLSLLGRRPERGAVGCAAGYTAAAAAERCWVLLGNTVQRLATQRGGGGGHWGGGVAAGAERLQATLVTGVEPQPNGGDEPGGDWKRGETMEMGSEW